MWGEDVDGALMAWRKRFMTAPKDSGLTIVQVVVAVVAMRRIASWRIE